MSELKVGQEVYYMDSNKPKKQKIKGISKHEGQCKDGSYTTICKEGEQKTIYHIGDFDKREAKELFLSMGDLKEHLFNTL